MVPTSNKADTSTILAPNASVIDHRAEVRSSLHLNIVLMLSCVLVWVCNRSYSIGFTKKAFLGATILYCLKALTQGTTACIASLKVLHQKHT